MSVRGQGVTGEKYCVDGGELLVDQAPPDGSLRELPAGLSSGLPLGSEQTNAARACLGGLGRSSPPAGKPEVSQH